MLPERIRINERLLSAAQIDDRPDSISQKEILILLGDIGKIICSQKLMIFCHRALSGGISAQLSYIKGFFHRQPVIIQKCISLHNCVSLFSLFRISLCPGSFPNGPLTDFSRNSNPLPENTDVFF